MKHFSILIWAVLTISGPASFVRREAFNNNLIEESKITGHLAKPGQFPFMALIKIANKTDLRSCGGTILNSKWVLTAAHCLYGITKITVHFGITDLTKNNPNKVTVVNPTFSYHPQFNPVTFSNDIGFIKLEEPLIFNEFIQPIQYLATSNIPDNAPVVAAGWGYTSNNSLSVSKQLYYVHQTTISNQRCVQVYGTKYVRNFVGCVEGPTNEELCQGDSGGPVIQIGKNGSFTHIGVISFGTINKCDRVSVYMRTFEFLGDIKNVTGI